MADVTQKNPITANATKLRTNPFFIPYLLLFC
jgi:hypothetical protein